MIIVDNREPRKLVDALVRRAEKNKQMVKIDKLNYGDIVVLGSNGCNVVIERKTINDLKKSIENGRFWKQMKGLDTYSEEFERWIVIEGNPYIEMKYKHLNLGRYIGMKLSILTGFGYKIYHSINMEETIMMVLHLDRKLNNGKENGRKDLVVEKKEVETEDDERLLMLMGVKGIGSKKADALLRAFGSVVNVVCCEEEKLEKILGKKLARKFKKIVTGRYGVD